MNPSINALNEADCTLHSLAQLIARTGTTQLPTQPDDSQANIDWNADRHRLEGRSFLQHGRLLKLVIDLSTFSLQFVADAGEPVASFAAGNRTPADATNWWQTVMQNWGLDTTKPLSYALTTAPILPTLPYTRPAGLMDWANWRTTASQQLTALNALSGRESEVRIWPHHFDTGVYYSIPDETGAEGAAIWAGYAIADSVCNEPYFYLSGYNSHSPIDFGAASGLTVGQWLTTPDWQGACLPVSDATAPDQISRFLGESYAWIAGNVRF